MIIKKPIKPKNSIEICPCGHREVSVKKCIWLDECQDWLYIFHKSKQGEIAPKSRYHPQVFYLGACSYCNRLFYTKPETE